MFLSLVIPTYNGEKYISECLDSCLNQNIPAEEYEVLCIDDGSSDQTVDIVRKYVKQHSNVRQEFKEHGIDSSRNVGLSLATGDYIWFIDQDDYICENCLERIRKVLQQTRCERLYFNYYEFVEELTDAEKLLRERSLLKPNCGNHYDWVVWCSVFNRSYLIDHELWPRSKRFGDRNAGYGTDSFFISECKESGIKEYFLSDIPYYYYRKHRGQSVYDYSDTACARRIEAYLAFPQTFRDEYNRALENTGSVTFKEARDYVIQVRSCAQKLQALPRKWKRIGMQKMREESLFPLELPAVYTSNYSWKDCVRAKNGKGPLTSIAFYYSVQPIGLFFYNILNVRGYPDLLKGKNKFFRKIVLVRLGVKNRVQNKKYIEQLKKT